MHFAEFAEDISSLGAMLQPEFGPSFGGLQPHRESTTSNPIKSNATGSNLQSRGAFGFKSHPELDPMTEENLLMTDRKLNERRAREIHAQVNSQLRDAANIPTSFGRNDAAVHILKTKDTCHVLSYTVSEDFTEERKVRKRRLCALEDRDIEQRKARRDWPDSDGLKRPRLKDSSANLLQASSGSTDEEFSAMSACERCHARNIGCKVAKINRGPCSACVHLKLPCIIKGQVYVPTEMPGDILASGGSFDSNAWESYIG